MAAGDTQIIISAVDRTQNAVASAERGLNGLKTSFGSLQSVIATITGLGAVTMFTQWATGTIAAAAALDDLADATGSSVESLSKLSNIAKVSGASFDTIDGAIKKLAVGMAGVDEESSRAGKALAAIGVQSRDPAQALTEIAQKFATYEDGANKAALAVAIFGKSGASLLPILKDIAENVDIAGTVTTQQAKAAEDLEKSYRRLGLAATGFKDSLLTDVVPALTATITSFNLARAAGLGFLDSVMMTGNYGPEGIANAVKKAADEVDRLRKAEQGAPSESWAEQYAKQLDVAEKKLRALKAIQDSIDAPNRSALKAIGDMMGPGSGKSQAPTIPGADPKTKAAIDYYLKGLGDIADALKAEDEARKKALEGYRQQLELIDKLYEANAKSIEQIDSTTEGYQKQIDALTMSKEAILLREQARLQAIVNARVYEGYLNAETEALQRQIDVIGKLIGAESASESAKAAQKAAEDWQRAADSIGDSLTDALLRGFESGKDFAKNFADTLYNMFRTLVLRPTIQAIMAPVAGGISSAFSGAAGASGGGASLLSGASSLFGGLGSFGSGAAISVGNIGSLGLLEGSMANFANIGGQLASGVSGIMPALGMAMPYIAAVVGVGMLVKSILDSKKGGPKTGGYGLAGAIEGVNRNQLFTPGQSDADAASIAKTVLTGFDQTLKALGGSGSAGFDIGYNTDPEGTAPNQLGVRAMVNGQQVYGYSAGESLGRDQAALEAAINLETKRALLAALQASDLPTQIGAVFNSISASGASADTIDNMMAFGAAMKTVIDAIGGSVVEDAQTAWEQSQRSSVQVLRDMGDEVIRLATDMDSSAEAMQALGAATAEYRQAVVQTLIAIKQIAAQVDEMFSATRNSLQTFGLTPEQLYDRYRADADAAASMLANETDPAQIQKLAERINNDINAAFAALGDEGKTAQQNPLLAYLDEIDAFVQSKLATIGAGIGSSTVDPFKAANDALDGAVAKFGQATDSNVIAADTSLEAANINLEAARLNLAASQTPMVFRIAGAEVNA
jgi:hypothetical protein